GNLDHIMLAGASASVLQGTVRAVGRVTWWPRTEWNLAIQRTGIEPSLLTEDPDAWPGTIAFDGRTSGYLDSLGPIGSLIIDSLGGALRDKPLRATGTVGFTGPSFESPGLTVNWGSAQLTGSGTVGDTIAAAYRLAISNLGTA